MLAYLLEKKRKKKKRKYYLAYSHFDQINAHWKKKTPTRSDQQSSMKLFFYKKSFWKFLLYYCGFFSKKKNQIYEHFSPKTFTNGVIANGKTTMIAAARCFWSESFVCLSNQRANQDILFLHFSVWYFGFQTR